MSLDSLLSNYRTLNESFRRKLYFHIGVNSGFFSEYNNMLLAILYCLEQRIQFVLYSTDANFAVERGWTDFFLPFCQETTEAFHHEYNYRWLKPWHIRRKIRIYFEKRRRKLDFLTHDIWRRFKNKKFAKRRFLIPELGIDGDLLEAVRVLHPIIWRYNEDTRYTVESLISSLRLPACYNGLHARSGDKVIEHKVFQPSDYMAVISASSQVKDIFVLTDDYRVFSSLKGDFPDYRFYTTCRPDERGYFHEEYMKLAPAAKAEQLLKLFSSMDVLAAAELFVGTYSSNPGMNLGMRMPRDRLRCVDYDTWQITW